MANEEQTISYDFDNQPQLFGHPIGLYVLFFTELWERFSYYGMRAIFTLYLLAKVSGENPGLGWDEVAALSLYGWYTMLVYVASIPGGVLADKYIGQKRAVMVGGWLLVIGHCILAVPAGWSFFTGLAFIIAGVGCLKSNVSTMVGSLYRKGDARRDQGFTVFYIGINIGAFLGALIVGIVADAYGWHWGFGLAGIGMAFGQLMFILGQRYLKGVGESPKTVLASSNEANTSLGQLFANLLKSPLQLGITILLAIIGIAAFSFYTEGWNQIGYSLLAAFLAATAGMLMMIYKDVNKQEKDRLVVILLSLLIVIVFWGAFEQAGGLMNIYTNSKINREVSQLALDVLFYGFGGFLLIRGILNLVRKQDTGYLFSVIGALVLIAYLILNQTGLITNPYEIPTAVFQSVNALFIMIFGTVVGSFWIWWKNRNLESSALFKMGIGTIIMGVGFVFMAKASNDIVNYGDQAALYLLILAYLFHTLGELCLSPVVMSFITKVSPVRYVSIMMGVYFAALGLGNKLAGVIGEFSRAESVKVELVDSSGPVTGLVDLENGKLPANFDIVGDIFMSGDDINIQSNGREVDDLLSLNEENELLLKGYLQDYPNNAEEPLKAIISFGQKEDKSSYSGKIEIFEVQDNQEFWTFISILGFTVLFGLLLILLLKPLKRMTHGADKDD